MYPEGTVNLLFYENRFAVEFNFLELLKLGGIV